MSSSRALIVGAVCSLIIQDGKILCLKRKNSSFYNGHWGIPAWKLDSGELPIAWAARELFEEVGLTAHPDSYTKHLIMYAHISDTPDGTEGRFYYFGIPEHWEWEAKNMEPNKASEIWWFPIDSLPEPFVPTQKLAIEAVLRGEGYIEYKWSFFDSVKNS